METKRNFLNHFQHPLFASGYHQNQSPNLFKDRNLNFEYNVPNNFPNKVTEDFLKFCLYVEKIDFEGETK